ncbi:hypothetical protein AXF42_Ash011429 [Apostasia shenzhenica]|uniref:Uncharacterized protein n=1 Tax=Apostasia shenzhenica TaxID=1088818 RepID=A0A2I0AEH0_9ASPA|nr:hypothetical protein AXF42_Ash011429 [Apostasia shenzhenica]
MAPTNYLLLLLLLLLLGCATTTVKPMYVTPMVYLDTDAPGGKEILASLCEFASRLYIFHYKNSDIYRAFGPLFIVRGIKAGQRAVGHLVVQYEVTLLGFFIRPEIVKLRLIVFFTMPLNEAFLPQNVDPRTLEFNLGNPPDDHF